MILIFSFFPSFWRQSVVCLHLSLALLLNSKSRRPIQFFKQHQGSNFEANNVVQQHCSSSVCIKNFFIFFSSFFFFKDESRGSLVLKVGICFFTALKHFPNQQSTWQKFADDDSRHRSRWAMRSQTVIRCFHECDHFHHICDHVSGNFINKKL